MKFFVYITLFSFIFIFQSCEKKNELDEFFDSMEKKLSNENLTRIQQTPPDSLFFVFEDYHQIYLESYEEKIKEKTSVNQWIEKQLDTLKELSGYHFLIYSFHGNLNDRNYSLPETYGFHKRYLKAKANKAEQILLEDQKQLLEYIDAIDKKLNLGDTFELVYPFERKNGTLRVRHGIFPYSSEIYSFEDSLFIRGILIKKINDSLNLQYLMRITDITETDVAVFGDSVVVGDTLGFYLMDYGREVKRIQ
jgi:hydroxymethylpyrimidine pyrophosphatase-like HAD family hydrolase